jgi:hypothetical protein
VARSSTWIRDGNLSRSLFIALWIYSYAIGRLERRRSSSSEPFVLEVCGTGCIWVRAAANPNLDEHAPTHLNFACRALSSLVTHIKCFTRLWFLHIRDFHKPCLIRHGHMLYPTFSRRLTATRLSLIQPVIGGDYSLIWLSWHCRPKCRRQMTSGFCYQFGLLYVPCTKQHPYAAVKSRCSGIKHIDENATQSWQTMCGADGSGSVIDRRRCQ